MGKQKLEDLDFIDFDSNNPHDSTVVADMIATAIRHRKWFMLSVTLCIIAGFLYVRSTPKTYSRTATVLVKDGKNGATISETAAFQDIFSFGGSSVDNELGIFKSRQLMQKVTRQLGLETSYKYRDGLRQTELYTSAPFTVTFLEAEPKQQIAFTATLADGKQLKLAGFVADGKEYDDILAVQQGDTTDTPIGKILISPTFFMNEEYAGKDIHVKKKNFKAASDGYNQELTVEVANKGSSLIHLKLEDENAKRAEDVLNTLIEVYKNDAVEDKNKIVFNTAQFINDRLEIIEKDLALVDAEIENYKKENKLTDITSESSLFLQSTSRLETEGLNVENQLKMAEYMMEYLYDASKATELIPASTGINDGGIQAQINEYNAALTRRNRLIANSSVNNPLVRDLNNVLASTRVSILRAVDNLIAGLRIQVANMRNKETENLSRIAHVPTQQKYVISIERQQKIKEELYLYLLNKKEENELQLSIADSNCRIVDTADGPELPIAPKKMQVVLISLLLGFMIPSIWLYAHSLVNTNIQTKKEVKAGVNIPFLGEIPLGKRKSGKDIVVTAGSRDSICEAFKILQDNLDFMNTGDKKDGKVIQLTSLNPNSGKTFISVNLGMSMALSNARVIVLDLDLRKGSLTKRSGAGTTKPGISAYLSGKVNDIKELIQPYDENGNLDIITSGPLPPNPAELLKGDKLNKLVDALREMYDYILLDNPPYGIVVDTSLCARLADQTVFVIRSGAFDKRQLPELQEIYDSNKMNNMISVAFNAVDYKKNGYGYGYGYGEGSGLEKTNFIRKFFGI